MDDCVLLPVHYSKMRRTSTTRGWQSVVSVKCNSGNRRMYVTVVWAQSVAKHLSYVKRRKSQSCSVTCPPHCARRVDAYDYRRRCRCVKLHPAKLTI